PAQAAIPQRATASQEPRIRRGHPSTQVIHAPQPQPIKVTMIWHDGPQRDYDAWAVAWTRSEVEVQWTTPQGEIRRDWVAASQVRSARRGGTDRGSTGN